MNHQKLISLHKGGWGEREYNDFLLFNIFPLNLIFFCLETKIILQIVLLDLPCDFEELNVPPDISER